MNLALQRNIGLQLGLEGMTLGAREGADDVLAGIGNALFVLLRGNDKHSLSASSPRRIQDLTVPTGLLSRWAICSWV